MKADLHIHTTASDGTLAPQEILEEATKAGLACIALTDHDTVDGLLTLHDLPQQQDVALIPGIEFSTDLPVNEIHILGYYIDIHHPALTQQLKLLAADRLRRADNTVSKLKQLGYSISYERVLAIAGGASTVGRPHVAAALLEAGYFTSMAEVFSELLRKNGPAYVPHYKLTPLATIELIKDAGGIAVLAHPGLVGDDRVVLDTIALGIQGLEVYHPKHTPALTAMYLKLAETHDLAVTGGSDFHGKGGRFPERLGDFSVPAALVDRLRQMAWRQLPAT